MPKTTCNLQPMQCPASLQATVRTNDMLNAVRQAQAILAAQEDSAGSQPPAAPRIDPIVGDEYYSMKTRLIVDEQLICRGTEFCLHMEHPHKWLFNYCRSLRCSCAVAKLACSIVNDSLVYTTLCLLTQPEELAAAALHVATLLLGVARQMPHSGSISWWTALGISLSTVENIGHQLLDMLTEHQAQHLEQRQSDCQTVIHEGCFGHSM